MRSRGEEGMVEEWRGPLQIGVCVASMVLSVCPKTPRSFCCFSRLVKSRPKKQQLHRNHHSTTRAPTPFCSHILSVSHTGHVQFLLFYILGKQQQPSLTPHFLHFLWKKFCSPSTPAVIIHARIGRRQQHRFTLAPRTTACPLVGISVDLVQAS